MNQNKIEQIIRELLIEIGEDPEREGLKDTPRRVAKTYETLTEGYRQDINKIIKNAVFESHVNNMIIARDIEIYSLCEHHMLPFYGSCHIGYIAKDRVLGISKLARIVDFYARRLQIQERLTEQIADSVSEAVDAVGVGVVIEARHLCMMMRGVEKQHSVMTTSSVLGDFRSSPSTRSEFFSLINRNIQ
jgi:GTP cyclohydrolase I